MELPILLLIAAVVLIVVLTYLYASLKAQVPVLVQQQRQEWQRTADAELQKMQSQHQEWQRDAEAELQKRVNLRYQEWYERELKLVKAEAHKEFEVFKTEAHKEAVTQAQNLYQEWCESQIESIKKEQKEVAIGEANNHLAQWLNEKEKSIRQDAIQKSQAVTIGKVTEQLIPYLPDFEYNPKDARFIGSPVDFIVFDGLSDDDSQVREVLFIEIKTGTSSLNNREKQVKAAIDARKVRWLPMRVNPDLQQASPKLFQ